jgi:hypothetical protein
MPSAGRWSASDRRRRRVRIIRCRISALPPLRAADTANNFQLCHAIVETVACAARAYRSAPAVLVQRAVHEWAVKMALEMPLLVRCAR